MSGGGGVGGVCVCACTCACVYVCMLGGAGGASPQGNLAAKSHSHSPTAYEWFKKEFIDSFLFLPFLNSVFHIIILDIGHIGSGPGQNLLSFLWLFLFFLFQIHVAAVQYIYEHIIILNLATSAHLTFHCTSYEHINK